ncbi:peptidase S8 [Wenjunlia vitaminophila]|uniref:Peptidase S8 n=1 Tax=Wenjunlia vitaminophila TaxID=76728 RepID=A0A0T6LQ03_WENVI|nr:S8 family peptidase [Wenjunlia vitaminophila]KRV48150.1 peptidase S8 [Wenjunlia vitaminophila]
MTKRRNITIGVATAIALAAVGTGLTLPANAAPKEGVVIGADSASAIPGSYIVTLKKSEHRAATFAGKSVVTDHGADIQRVYTHALNGYAVTMSADEARQLAADPAVDKVYADQKVSLMGTQTNPANWGLDRVDQPSLPLNQTYNYPDTAGSGVTAYVIDTGVRITHQDLEGRASNGYDAIDGDNVAQDGNGHGTHVATTIAGGQYGVAKKANIVAVRVLNNSGSGTTAQVVAGVDWVTANHSGPSVANMSLGAPSTITAIDDAVRNSIASGVTYAIAAGNSNVDAKNTSPAHVTEAITVGATDSSDTRAYFSNYGNVVDLFAPGVSITAGWNTGDTATNTISGTSMATPHTAGAAAIYLGTHPDATPAQVQQALIDGTSKNVVTDPGRRTPNRLLNIVP